jgi:hypothetical protein
MHFQWTLKMPSRPLGQRFCTSFSGMIEFLATICGRLELKYEVHCIEGPLNPFPSQWLDSTSAEKSYRKF